MARALLRIAALVALALSPASALAHEVRPAYLELREEANGVFDVLWKTPLRGEYRLALEPRFSGTGTKLGPVATRQTRDAVVQTSKLAAGEGLRGQSITIEGLDRTLTDALVRIEFADGSTWVKRLTAHAPSAEIRARTDALSVAGEYLGLGVGHILLGVDHLLFVLALLMLSRGRWPLVRAITAFTIAHSFTLALATLGFVHVPQTPVEAVIALSVAFLAVEIVRARQGRTGVAARSPWIVAFAFGLLHGLGFAGALAEIGLPEGHIPLALLFFNLGVELGQLLFIAAALGTAAVAHRLPVAMPRWAGWVPPYAIGSVAMLWVVQRVAAF